MPFFQKKRALSKSFLYTSLFSLLCFLAGLNLLAMRGIFLLAAFSLEMLRLLFARKLDFNPVFFIVLLFPASLGTMYAIYYGFDFIQLILIGLLPPIAFLIGAGNADGNRIRLFLPFCSFAGGYALLVVLNVIASIVQGIQVGSNGFSSYYDVMLHDLTWRTFASIDLVPLLGLATACLINPPKKKRPLIILISSLLLFGSVILNAFVGNRSFIVVAPAVLLFSVLYAAIKHPNKKKRCALAITTLSFAVLALVSFFVIQNDFLGVKSFLLNIPAFARFADKTGSGRAYQYWAFQSEWLVYPFGGMSVANLFYGFEIHNTFLQVYCIGGWVPFVLEGTLLLLLLLVLITIKWDNQNYHSVSITISSLFAFLAICCLEPMITSEPFICASFFVGTGYLYGEWAKQRNRKPLLRTGLSHFSGPSLSVHEFVFKLSVAILAIGGSTFFSVLSESGSVFSVIALLLLAVAFALIDKTNYASISVIKTALCLFLSCGFAIVLNIYLPTSTWMYALAKSALSIAVFIFLRVVVVSKKEEKDGYYRLRNFFTKLARDIDGSPEENLVSQNLQTNNEGE